jgi:hypothetical protein
MPTQLATPIAQATITDVTVLGFEARWTAGTLSAILVRYVASDANDNPIQGADPPLVYAADTPTMTAALTAFYGAGAHPKIGALAAFAVLNPALVESST